MKPEVQQPLNFERQVYACRTCVVELGRDRGIVMAMRPQLGLTQGQRTEHEGFVCPRGDHRPWDKPRRTAA